jgi:hypothetical protein
MEWSKKINNKKYIFGTLISLGLVFFVTKGAIPDVLYLMAVILGSVANQWLMFAILGKILSSIMAEKKLTWLQKLTFWLQIALKFSLLGCIFYILIVHARHIVAQGLILYTFQLIILVLSIKNIAASLKKGSSE